MGAEVKRRVLLVDDEEDLVWSIKSRLGKVMPELSVDGTSVPEEAARLLETNAYDLVISDIRMPRMSGIELLIKARSLHPALPFVVITAFPSEEGQREAMRLGSVCYLEKPFQIDALTTAIRTQLARRPVGFSGALQLETLPDLVQLFTISNTTGLLRIWHEGEEGLVWFDRGSIISASAGTRVGSKAFYEILSWSAGQFSMERHVQLPERTIFESPAGLLIEAFRLLDEAKRDGFGSGSDESFLDDVDAAMGPSEPSRTLDTAIAPVRGLGGYLGSCLIDVRARTVVESDVRSTSLDVAAAGLCNIEVVERARQTLEECGVVDVIEDFVVTVSSQYHLLRPVSDTSGRFIYLVVDRQAMTLAAARLALKTAERHLCS